MSLIPLLYGISHVLAVLVGGYFAYAMMSGRLLTRKLYAVADPEKLRQKYSVNRPSLEDEMARALSEPAVNPYDYRKVPQAGAVGEPLRDHVLKPSIGPASPSAFQK